MKLTCCDICGDPIVSGEYERTTLCVPSYISGNANTPSDTVTREYADVCVSCRRELAKKIEDMQYCRKHIRPFYGTDWTSVSVRPEFEGRYLVIDYKFDSPHTTIALYEQDEGWVTNALIEPEDIVYWMPIPEAPQRPVSDIEEEESDDGEEADDSGPGMESGS